jgi:predicted enzyme related to lactoylglutathione lyase
MIIGAHTLLYAKDADKARAFFRDVLEFRHVDAGEGWLIFALPPGEIGIHPGEENGDVELYLMCDDVEKTVKSLKAKGVVFTKPITDQGYGIMTALQIPGGPELGLYQPRHPLASSVPTAAAKKPKAKARAARKVKPARKAVQRSRR